MATWMSLKKAGELQNLCIMPDGSTVSFAYLANEGKILKFEYVPAYKNDESLPLMSISE